MLQLALPPADKILKTTPSTSLVLPPTLPVGGVQLEAALPKGTGVGKGKGKSVIKRKGKGQDGGGGGDDKDGDNERRDQADNDNDTSYEDSYGLSAECVVQQVSYHSILPEIRRTNLRFH